MTEQEYEVLGELYFIQSLQQLHLATGSSEGELLKILEQLYQRGWINIFRSLNGDKIDHTVSWNQPMKGYYFVASRKGLFAHNSV